MNFERASQSSVDSAVNEGKQRSEHAGDGELAVNEDSDRAEPTVVLQWAEDDEPPKPIKEAIEANSRMIADLHETYAPKYLERGLESTLEEVDAVNNRFDTLQKRVGKLEQLAKQLTTQINHLSRTARTLISVSDLTTNGTCPECEAGPLEVKKGFGNPDRVECANTKCGHIAAELQ